MNKKKGIIIGVLAVALVMVVGYALFSDTLTINGTATAKGEFALSVTCDQGITTELYETTLDFYGQVGSDAQNEIKQALDYAIENEGGYVNDTCSVNGNKVSFSASLNYPTATRYFSIKVTNTGSIPFYLKSTNLQNSSVEGTVIATDGTLYDANMLFTNVKENMVKEPELMSADVVLDSNVEDISDIYINTGESMYFISAIQFPDDTNLTNTKPFNSYDITISETAELIFEQKAN